MFGLGLLVILVASSEPPCAKFCPCELSDQIRAELQKAAATPVTDRFNFDDNTRPFLELRKRFPDNLFVHERYQDAVRQHGIEGHLRALTEEYQTQFTLHPGELFHRYLYVRTLVGRNTPSATRNLTELISEYPDFAPAHRTLAEVYSHEAFRDAKKERVEREKFLSLCPGATFGQLISPLPEASLLIDEAERLFAKEKGAPDRIVKLCLQAMGNDEWRLQRIAALDWYTAEYRRQEWRKVQRKYSRFWKLAESCMRTAGRQQEAAEFVSQMEKQAARLARRGDPIYADSIETLLRVYVDRNEKGKAAEKLEELSKFLAEHPQPQDRARLRDLRKLIANLGS